MQNNAAIVFHSDHGWSLGEQGLWRKFTNFELSTRVPLIISVPWMEAQPSQNSNLAELVDVLPTIVELSGVTVPMGEPSYDGTSLVPMLRDSSASVKTFAQSQTTGVTNRANLGKGIALSTTTARVSPTWGTL